MKDYLKKLVKGADLSTEEAQELIGAFVAEGNAEATNAQIGAYLFSSASRALSSDELLGAALALRASMRPIDLRGLIPGISILDTCGTGGSGLKTFNTSTAVAFVLAAMGQAVAKHGNRAVSSQSGSADVLSVLGVNTEMSEERLLDCFKETRYCFLFAPRYHAATKRVALARQELGLRTIFNFLGPLVNPASPDVQLLGVSDARMQPVIAETLLKLNIDRAMVVRGENGLDELTPTGVSEVYQIEGGSLRQYQLRAKDIGIQEVSLEDIIVESPEKSAEEMKQIFKGKQGACTELVCLNAGAALVLIGQASSLIEGVKAVREKLSSGEVFELLERIVELGAE